MHNTNSQIDEIANIIADDAVEQSKPQIKQAEKPAEAPQAEVLDEKEVISESAEPIEGGDESVEASESEQVDGSSTEEAAEAVDGDDGLINTRNNLAETLDSPIEDMYQLNVKMNGDNDQTIGQLKDFFENNQDIETIRTGITEKEQALTQQSEDVAKIPEISNEFLQARANVLSISQQYERVDWNALRQSDPGQYAALQSDFNTQYSLAQQAEKEVQSKVDEHSASQARFQQDRLFSALPELKDEAVRNKAAKSVQKLASKYGYSAKEIGDITDSRLMHLLIDAARGHDAVESVKEKQVEKLAPKSKKPAAVKSVAKDASRNAVLKKLTDKAMSSNKREDKLNAVSALIG